MELSVVVLAAGKGKRMFSSLPKVLHKLGGTPLLTRVVHTAQSFHPKATYIVYGHQKEQVREALSDLNVTWVDQGQPLGTGHALLQVIPQTPDNHRILVLYGDTPLIQIQTLQKLLDETPSDGLGILVAKVDQPQGLGRILRDGQGAVVAIVEHKDANAQQLTINEINTGILTAPASLLKKWLPQLKNQNAQGEFYLTDIIALAVSEKVTVNSTSATCNKEISGVNDRKELIALERHYQKQLAENFLLQGVTIADPLRFDCRGDATLEQDVFIDINVVLEGQVSVAQGSSIGPNCVLKNVRIGKNVLIKSNCVIEDATIADNCIIGPFARLRPDTHLNENVHIGNFVELKKTTVQANSKVNHLTYLGDSIVGADVNVGAGTITCNYDGTNKYTTVIKDKAFIGSGTQLIAPVVIGEGAYVGAGSTITQDAPDNQLTVSRARQITVKGWKKKIKDETT